VELGSGRRGSGTRETAARAEASNLFKRVLATAMKAARRLVHGTDGTAWPLTREAHARRTPLYMKCCAGSGSSAKTRATSLCTQLASVQEIAPPPVVLISSMGCARSHPRRIRDLKARIRLPLADGEPTATNSPPNNSLAPREAGAASDAAAPSPVGACAVGSAAAKDTACSDRRAGPGFFPSYRAYAEARTRAPLPLHVLRYWLPQRHPRKGRTSRLPWHS